MKRIIIGVLFGLFTSSAVLAATENETFARIDELQAQTQKLQKEIACLRTTVCRLKRQQARGVYCPRRYAGNWYNPFAVDIKKFQECESIGKPVEAGFSVNNKTYTNDFIQWWRNPRGVLLLAAMGATVTTSPFLGLRSAFDASDLIVNLPTMNEDLRFLKQHVEVVKKLCCYGLQLPNRPIIILGGKIEGIAFLQDNWHHHNNFSSDIDLGSARLDVLIDVSHAVHAFMAFNMDTSTFDLMNNSNLDIQLAGSGNRISNSRVFVSRAFVTIGDLNYSPLYFTIGQMFVPFGRYASNMVTSVLTIDVGRVNERAILLGFYEKGLYGSVYIFKDEPAIGTHHGVDQGGVNLGYEKNWDDSSLNIGAGYITDIAGATGFQNTGASLGFFGFGITPLTEALFHAVPAVDVHGEFALGKFSLFAEYITATNEFDFRNLSFNFHGARPSASNFEAAYNFNIWDKPSSVAIGFGTTSEALALNLPKNSFLACFNISIWKDTIESIEYRHDTGYELTDVAGGNGARPAFVFGQGGDRNTVTFQLGVYF